MDSDRKEFVVDENLSEGITGDEICVTGISGRFPNSDSIPELAENLFNKVKLQTPDNPRWNMELHPDMSRRHGIINDINKFDGFFFNIRQKQISITDPQIRILLEKTYEALFDAGINPKTVKDKDIGVYVGIMMSETETFWLNNPEAAEGLGVGGTNRGMFANRISYWLGVTGPSFTVDTACSSGLTALYCAFRDIKNGVCTSAIVAGANICLHPSVTTQYTDFGALSLDGFCKSFDETADGYSRSEGIAVIYIQKYKDANRVYAQIVNTKINCDGFKTQGIHHPSEKIQAKLLKETYEEVGVNPMLIEYVEAHGTGTRAGDPREVKAIDDVFCQNRKDVLKIGTIKSNIGHTEPASGICAIIKMCIAYHTGYIPPNIHYNTPKKSNIALVKGRMAVVVDKTPWNRTLCGINGFGFGGSNAHVILKRIVPIKRNKNAVIINESPKLVCVSGRTESAVKRILDAVESCSDNTEFIRLLHGFHDYDIAGHLYRGYSILNNGENKEPLRHIQHYSGVKRPIWFVFSGMGSQWAGCGKDLLRFPIFAATIKKCHAVLEPKGVNLLDIMTNPDPKIFDNIMYSFVAITAIQVALCDVIKELQIEPDNMIGHSMGEMACGYADGCLSLEEAVLCSYYRGIASIDTPLIYGAMAAIGLGYNQIKDMLPDDIEVGCHNAPDSCTISGPAESVQRFVQHLKSLKIFAKEVQVSNIAFHSSYIKDAGPNLLENLRKIMTKPKLRSVKWISSSVPKHLQDEEESKYSSPEYYTNNLLNAVLFEEAAEEIPPNSIIIEIAPHGLLGSILRRSHKQCINIALMHREQKDNLEYFITAFGKMYEEGLNPQLEKIYPEVQLPVSLETPMSAHLVEWIHDKDWFVWSPEKDSRKASISRTVKLNTSTKKWSFLKGHVIGGLNLFPAAGYLFLAWETFAVMMGKRFERISVVFEDLNFMRATKILNNEVIKFEICVQKHSGNFEILEGDSPIVTGRIRESNEVHDKELMITENKKGANNEILTGDEVYKEFRLRGYNYKDMFRGVEWSGLDGNEGSVQWRNNWITFIDTILQFKLLKMDTRSLFVPTTIDCLSIDVESHSQITFQRYETSLPVLAYSNLDILVSGGVQIRGIHAKELFNRESKHEPVLETYQFVPNEGLSKNAFDLETYVTVQMQIVLENLSVTKLKLIELIDSYTSPNVVTLSPIVQKLSKNIPLLSTEPLILSDCYENNNSNIKVVDLKGIQAQKGLHLFIGSKLLTREDPDLLVTIFELLNDGAFVLSREDLDFDFKRNIANHKVVVATSMIVADEIFILFKKRNTNSLIYSSETVFIYVDDPADRFPWLEKVKTAINDNKKTILINQNDKYNGILGLVNCLRREPGTELIRCFSILDSSAPKFNPDSEFYKTQLEKNVAFNIYKNGKWGTYRHLKFKSLQDSLVDHSFLNGMQKGNLQSTRWIEGPLRTNRDKELVHVYYSGLNFKDTVQLMGRIQPIVRKRTDEECFIGLEYSGKLASGQRVLGIVNSKGITNLIKPYGDYVWPVPDDWSLEDAATVPLVYLTALMALIMEGNIKPGQTVLIHSGMGGVGQAAINICLYYKCKIFTTVGTPEKRIAIKKLFPQLTDDCIGCSRDTSFEKLVRNGTDGKGVDIVLNSLVGEKLQASLRCLGIDGKFLEIQKYDISRNVNMGMRILELNTSVSGIILDKLPELGQGFANRICNLFHEGIKKGFIKPLSRHVYDTTQVDQAFNYLFVGNNFGKVLIKIRDEEADKNIKPTKKPMLAMPRYLPNPQGCYVVVGGLGGLGLEVVDWLVLKGATKVVINSRRGITAGYQAYRIKSWKKLEAEIVINTDDVTTQKGCEQLLKSARTIGPVRGIFNLAAILDDAIFVNQTVEKFRNAFAPKTLVTKYLDIESRKLCPQLADFVIFSSLTCGRGNAGQSNYGMANSVMERICEERKSEGLPVLAIQWGAVGQVGLVAEMFDEHVEIAGTFQQSVSSCMSALSQFMRQTKHCIVSSMVVSGKNIKGMENMQDVTIMDAVTSILSIKDLEAVSHEMALSDIGLDSMMSMEIKQCFEKDFQIIVTEQEIRKLTLSKLQYMSNQMKTSKISKIDQGKVKPKFMLKNIGTGKFASRALVNMPTLIREEDANVPHLFMLPGIEGGAETFETICKKLRCKATILQFGYHEVQESIEEIAERLLPVIRPFVIQNGSFILAAYSFGCVVAYELVRRLESEGFHGILFLIDGTADYLIQVTNINYKINDEKVIRGEILLPFLSDVEITTEVFETMSFDEQVDITFDELAKQKTANRYSKEHFKNTVQSMAKRILSIKNYKYPDSSIINSLVVLIKAEVPFLGVDVDNEYNFQEHCNETIEVFIVSGDHTAIIENIECSDIMNNVWS